MPKQPRGKRIGSDDHEFAVVSKNSNGDGSVYFEPGRTEKDGRVRKRKWRATYRDVAGKVKRVSAPTRVQAEVRRSEKLAEIEDAPKVGSRFSRDTTVAELAEDAPSSPRFMPTAGWISVMSPATSATPTHRPRPATSAASATDRPTLLERRRSCSTRRSTRRSPERAPTRRG